ncbi:MAG: FecR domain-containing protein [Burkholderiales bacterium]|nr:FecR domain-containing protein [Burkholderiales bacterium]
MQKLPPFARRRAGRLGMMVAIAFPAFAYAAPAARVDFAIGNAVATGQDGKTRTLTKGAEVAQGDTVDTRDGRVQLRFVDGAFVSLQPQSQFRIDEFRFNGTPDGSEKGFFSLLKGGLRTITGLVGRVNKNAYQVSTTVATIGIRGTEYTIQYGKSVTGSVGEGEINVCNGGGCLGVGSGESYYVRAPDIAPVLTDKTVDLPPQQPTPPAPLLFVKSDDRQPDGKPSFLKPDSPPSDGSTTPLVETPPESVAETFTADFAFSHNRVGSRGTGIAGPYSAPTAINDVGALIQFESDIAGNTYTTSSNPLSFYDGVVGWGRFVNPVFQGTGNLSGAATTGGESFHYVFGIPGSVPTSGTASYALNGGTTPTFNDSDGLNVQVGSLNSASMTVDFSQFSAALDFVVTAPAGYGGEALHASASGSIVSGHVLDFTSVSVTSSSTCFSAGCSGDVRGFLAGANASHAGIAYELFLPGSNKAVGTFGMILDNSNN